MPLLKGRWATNAMDDSAYLVSIRNILLCRTRHRGLAIKPVWSIGSKSDEHLPTSDADRWVSLRRFAAYLNGQMRFLASAASSMHS